MNYIDKFKESPLTYGLMAVCVIVFFIPLLNSAWDEPLYLFGVLHGYSVVVLGEFYRLGTSIFMHADAMHIVMNMLSLYMVGTMVEKLFSKVAYLSIYFVSALFGSFASIYMHLGGQAVGASGAIFGLFGALAGFAFVHRNTMRKQFMSFMKNFGVILLINLVIGFAFPSIDVSAHVGGLLAGIVGGLVIAKKPQYIWAYLGVSATLLILFFNYISTLYATAI
jgi:rhomboid protease GluP